ncbi:MAG: type II toxin-antitoxin system RelE/ParE family toxin, partial [Pseudomonadota bacterium]
IIRDYYEPRDSEAYHKILITIFASIDLLSSFPLLGRAGAVSGTRELKVPRYDFLVTYSLPDDVHVDVERILHTSLQYPLPD